MRVTSWIPIWTSLAATSIAASGPDLTTKHEPGRCAIRGHCGSQSLFGSQLPCPDNGLAKEPSPDVRDSLVSLCGDRWADTKVCCEQEQIEALQSNLQKAQNI
ncbi:hypothetical protein KC318_g17201, partial [Hortaea werneckii]